MILASPKDEIILQTSTPSEGVEGIKFRMSNGKIMNIENIEIVKGDFTIVGDFTFTVMTFGKTDVTFYSVDENDDEIEVIETFSVTSSNDVPSWGLGLAALFVIISVCFLVYLLQISEKNYFSGGKIENRK